MAKDAWRHDPRFVKFEVELLEAFNDGPRGIQSRVLSKVGVHVCTEDDWKKLYKPKNAMDKNTIGVV